MIPISIQIKQALAKLILPFLFVMASLIMLFGQAKPKLIEDIRLKVIDFLLPAYVLVERPFDIVHGFFLNVNTVKNISQEKKKLEEENAQLKGWYHVAIGLAEENVELKNQLHWIPDPTISYITAHVAADGSGIYHKAVLVMLQPGHGVHAGEIALSGFGLIGRVTEIGDRSARILLINDLASRIPVNLMSSHVQAIMAGDNSLYPKLIFYPEDKPPTEGEKVLTDNKGNAFPTGIPVGFVHYLEPGHPVVVPYTSLESLRIVRIFDFKNYDIIPPDAPGRVNLAKKKMKTRPVANPELLGHD